MKKLLIVVSIFLLALPALADVNVTVSWDPEIDPAVTGQNVVYDPDQAVSGDDVIIATVAPGVSSHSFTRLGNDAPNDAVRIDTLYGGNTVPSLPVALVCVGGATVTTVTTVCN
ncbi:MAG: hypothetical protein KJN72_12200 [Woeseia sp.]|nr:hypothetical protein [Woeseia sp.]